MSTKETRDEYFLKPAVKELEKFIFLFIYIHKHDSEKEAMCERNTLQ